MSVTVRINIHLLTYYCNKQIIIIIDNPFNLFSSKFQMSLLGALTNKIIKGACSSKRHCMLH